MSDPGPAIELGGFSYRYPDAAGPALREIDLRIEPGEMVVLSGRSGSGKSTLLRAAAGLIPHFYGGDVAGTARIFELDLREHGAADLGRFVGMVAQEPGDAGGLGNRPSRDRAAAGDPR